MAVKCFNCSAEMTGVGQFSTVAMWCPRCGSVDDGINGKNTPILVFRAKALSQEIDREIHFEEMERLDRFGITECITSKD